MKAETLGKKKVNYKHEAEGLFHGTLTLFHCRNRGVSVCDKMWLSESYNCRGCC